MRNRKFDSRVSGEIFIEPQLAPVMSSIETRCVTSRLDRKGAGKIVRFYRYFAPTALGILILAASILLRSAEAQRRAQTARGAWIQPRRRSHHR